MNQILEGKNIDQDLNFEVVEPIIKIKKRSSIYERKKMFIILTSFIFLFILLTGYYTYANFIAIPTNVNAEKYLPVTDIILDGDKIVLSKNDTYILIPTIVPDNSTNRKIIYESQDLDVFEIDVNGLITPKKGGKSKAIMRIENEDIQKEVQVIVQNVAENIIVEEENITLEVGESKQINASITPTDSINQNLTWYSADENIVKVSEEGNITAIGAGYTTITVQTIYQPVISKTIQIEVNKNGMDMATAGVNSSNIGLKYVNGVLIVNKKYTLPSTYNPGLDKNTLENFNKMQREAASEGISLKIISGFRSYQTQKEIFVNNAKLYGEKEANRSSAIAGQSEHQAGLALDINSLSQDFANTKEGKWLAKNCHKYGFIIRYPEGKEHITGYIYEPWHVRYVGVPLSTQIYESGLTLEEYLHIE